MAPVQRAAPVPAGQVVRDPVRALAHAAGRAWTCAWAGRPTRAPAPSPAPARASILALAFAATALAAGPVAAQDADGAALFSRRCASCHVVQAPDGRLIAGRAARTGPDLYGVADRPPASVPGFPYGDGLTAWSAAGGVWDEASFTAYLVDPPGFLARTLGRGDSRNRMAFQLRDPREAAAIWAFLVAAGRGLAPL